MENEIWKPVIGYEGIYEVSSKGRVKSLARTVIKSNGTPQKCKERILSAGLNSSGYAMVRLCKERKAKTYGVHLLVAEAFLGHKPCGYTMVIDHINEVSSDNNLSNLRVIPQRENCHRSVSRSRGLPRGVSKSTHKEKPFVARIGIKNKELFLGRFATSNEASAAYESAKLVQNTIKQNEYKLLKTKTRVQPNS